jgi:hypothetical protein
MKSVFVPQVTSPEAVEEPAYWFVFSGFNLLVHRDENTAQVPRLRELNELGLTAVHQQYLDG